MTDQSDGWPLYRKIAVIPNRKATCRYDGGIRQYNGVSIGGSPTSVEHVRPIRIRSELMVGGNVIACGGVGENWHPTRVGIVAVSDSSSGFFEPSLSCAHRPRVAFTDIVKRLMEF